MNEPKLIIPHKECYLLSDKDLKFKVGLDGDALCITGEDFIDLQVSPAFFVSLSKAERERFQGFVEKVVKKKKSQGNPTKLTVVRFLEKFSVRKKKSVKK